jgi:hypothetical protein
MDVIQAAQNRDERTADSIPAGYAAAPAGQLIQFGVIRRAALVAMAVAGWLGAQKPSGAPDTFNPAGYVRLFEDTGTRRILIYDPARNELNSSQMRVDGRSTIHIEVAKDLIDQTIPMNRLFMTATLARSGGQSEELEVIGYSEVGKSQEEAESQNAVALQTAANVQRTLLNMFFTTKDLIDTFYGDAPGCPEKLALDLRAACGAKPVSRSVAEARFRLYEPEIRAIAEFFVRQDTSRVAGLLGSQAFDVDIASLRRIAQQYLDNTTALFDPSLTENRKQAVLTDLVERTKLIWHDFRYIADEVDSQKRKLLTALQTSRAPACLSGTEFADFKQRYEEALLAKPEADQRLAASTLETTALHCYSYEWGEDIAGQLRRYLVPAQIFLGANDVKPGDTVTLRIEARESAGSPIGVPAQFLLSVRDRSTRVAVSPSLFFIKRLNVTDADIDITKSNAIKAVDFSPFPGVTFGAVFHSRGLTRVANKDWDYEALETAGSRFLGALAPGIGINVTFMNFGDPRDFNPAANDGAGAFTTTTGTNFEVGAGVVGSLFNNNLQFTYGYNLNAGRKNSYFGVGFGFIEVGKRLAGFLGP